MTTAVVLAARNEATVLGGVLEELCREQHRVVVVDDGSTDDTWEIVSAFPVHRLRHPRNLGQGAALRTGTEAALDLGADHVVHFDADGQHLVSQIEPLLAPVRSGAADIALGSRFLRPEDSRRVPAVRRIVLRTAVVVNFLLTGVRLTDAHNGMRAMNRTAAASIRIRHDRAAHATEILAEIRRRGLRYLEVPTTIRYTEYSRRKGQRGWHALDTLYDLLLRRPD